MANDYHEVEIAYIEHDETMNMNITSKAIKI